ncbi:hypothetical protein IW262DRAFT_1466198 [Armillaria fumosa]|nr:hypothetical protein IW262DRAFT_1466198 [Armillaria fumosa]
MSDSSAQFWLLLCGLLEHLPDLVDGGPLAVIIDGLDECDMSDDLLAVLAEGFATAFKEQDCMCTLHLDMSSKDVDLFQAKCNELDAIKKLAARASGLFILAATIAKFVHAFPAISRLQSLLATDIPSDALEALATLYHTTLNTPMSELPGANADIKKYVCNVLGAVLVAQILPGMTEGILDTLVLDEGSPPSHHIVSMLGSVLSPETEDSPI